MSVRIERVELIEEGWSDWREESRTVLTGFPPEAIEAAEEAFWYATGNDSDALKAYAAALWGHITGDNK